ncbi:MAG: hypothetical protein WBA10_20875 [Elainellaceae cyanobacterium]
MTMTRRHRHSAKILTLAAMLAIAGCGQTPVQSESAPAISADPDAEVVADLPPPATPESQVISTHGIGPAQLGLTLGELKTLLGSGTTFVAQSPFLAEFDATAVRQDGDILFHILHLAGEPIADTDAIQGVLTTNPAYETAEGIGVGTPIAEAEAAYGTATLSHHKANASLEYVRFDAPPAANISFGTWFSEAVMLGSDAGTATASYAGQYPQQAGDYRETTEYQPESTIKSVLVVCLTETCASES